LGRKKQYKKMGLTARSKNCIGRNNAPKEGKNRGKRKRRRTKNKKARRQPNEGVVYNSDAGTISSLQESGTKVENKGVGENNKRKRGKISMGRTGKTGQVRTGQFQRRPDIRKACNQGGPKKKRRKEREARKREKLQNTLSELRKNQRKSQGKETSIWERTTKKTR